MTGYACLLTRGARRPRRHGSRRGRPRGAAPLACGRSGRRRGGRLGRGGSRAGGARLCPASMRCSTWLDSMTRRVRRTSLSQARAALDEQTAAGKVPVGVARRAKRVNPHARVVAVAGRTCRQPRRRIRCGHRPRPSHPAPADGAFRGARARRGPREPRRGGRGGPCAPIFWAGDAPPGSLPVRGRPRLRRRPCVRTGPFRRRNRAPLDVARVSG